MNITPNEGAGAAPSTGEAGQATNTEAQETTQGAEGAENTTPPEEKKQERSAEWYEKQLQKEQRRINRLTKAKYEERGQNKILLDRLEKLEKAQAQSQDVKPNADKYETYEDYLLDLADWKRRQASGAEQTKPAEAAQPQPQSRVPQQEAGWQKQMENQTIEQAKQLAQHIPDFSDVWNENGEFFDAMPYELEKTLYQSPHPALAVYVLGKEGKLEDLLDMTPQQAAFEIGRATHVGVSNIKSWAKAPAQTQATKAPAPLSGNKAAGASGKSEDQMSGKELLRKNGLR